MQTRETILRHVGAPHERIRARYGLVLRRGNARPYFTITGTVDAARDGFWREDSGGCIHDTILTHWPDLAPLVALHMSDDDGAPLHAEANGYYFLAGAAGGLSQRYHAGNAVPPHTPDECLAIFAGHCRIDMAEAARIRDAVAAVYFPAPLGGGAARKTWAAECDAMRPRWQAEAAAAIRDFSLTITREG